MLTHPAVTKPTVLVAHVALAKASAALAVLHTGAVRMILADVTPIAPNAAGLPGSGTLSAWTGGLESVAGIVAGIALLLGAIAYALGKHGGNYAAKNIGFGGIIGGALLAFFTGAVWVIVNFFLNAGSSLH